jgi:hypothetical protein
MTMAKRDQVIGSIRRYRGTGHVWAVGCRVVVAAVHRGDNVLRDDAAIVVLLPGDWVEFAPLIEEADGVERASFAWSDALPNELGPSEGEYRGPLPETLLASRSIPYDPSRN